MKSSNDGFTIGNLLDYLYYRNNYKLIGVGISRQQIQELLKKLILQK